MSNTIYELLEVMGVKNIVKSDAREREVSKEHERHLRKLLKKAKDEGNVMRMIMLQLILLVGEDDIITH